MVSKNEIKYIQSLRQKKKRKEAGVFIVESPKPVEELLQSDLSIEKIYAVPQWAELNQRFADLITIVTHETLQQLSALTTSNQVMAIVKEPVRRTEAIWKNELFIALDGIQDPGNLGTIIRIADWFNIQNIVASEDTVDVYDHKVIRSTMGSFARVHIEYKDLRSFFTDHDVDVYAAMLNGSPVNEMKKINKGCLLIGNEANGVRDGVVHFAKHHITIPRYGKAESLNAAVATAIILSHLK